MKNIRRIALLALVCLLTASAAASTPGVIEFYVSDSGQEITNFSQKSSADGGDELIIPMATLCPEAAALPWNLTLVNSTHPVPDNWQVQLKTLSNGQQVDERIYADLQAMFDDCRAAGLKPKVNTSYRTYDDQKKMLITKYRQQKNSGLSHADAQEAALKWASYPGYSEHQLGLAVDINSADKENCSNESVWDWLKHNCQKYGFIWRYPGVKSDITGISNEDWHFRYVGKEAAEYIMSNRLCLEEYLQQQYGVE